LLFDVLFIIKFFGCNHNDSNDYWQILVDGYAEPVRPDKSSATPVIEVVNSLVRFRHVNEHCYLHYSGMNLPNWGFEQGEVTCNPFYSKSGNLWNFETIADPRVEAFTLKHSKPLSFLERVVELNALMMEVSNKFKPKPGENPSRPWDWPLLKQGYHFNPYYEHNHRIFLMGNPLVFGVCGLSLIAYCFLLLFYAIIRGKGVATILYGLLELTLMQE
jgi:dolichyl-phosphate-mannose-protein mannosyltransferase